jgi:hypothetical protein
MHNLSIVGELDSEAGLDYRIRFFPLYRADILYISHGQLSC